MTKKISYECNLCRVQKDATLMRGIYFFGVKGLEFRQPIGVENHLCKECLTAIDDALQAEKDKAF